MLRDIVDHVQQRIYTEENMASLCPDEFFSPFHQTSRWSDEILESVQDAVENKVWNVLLFQGPRGVGKTWAVNYALGRAQANNIRVVRLSGLIHTNERQVLKSIAHQLSVSGAIDFDAPDFSSSGALMNALHEILDGAKVSRRRENAKTLVFILDEFDAFAVTSPHFLYTLFDGVHDAKNLYGAAIIGLSARTNSFALLERRIQSRAQTLPKSFTTSGTVSDFLETVKTYALVGGSFDPRERWNGLVSSFILAYTQPLLQLWATYGLSLKHIARCWMRTLRLLEYQVHKNEAFFPDEAFLAQGFGIEAADRDAPLDARPDLLNDLSTVHLAVCIAAMQLKRIANRPEANLEMVYDVYSAYVKDKRINAAVAVFSKDTLAAAMDHLISRGVFIATTGGSVYQRTVRGRPFDKFYFVPEVDAVRDVLERCATLPSSLLQWSRQATLERE